MFIIYELNFRTRLSLSIYLFFNNKRRYFAMRVATASHKVAAVLQETGRSAIGAVPWSFRWWRPSPQGHRLPCGCIPGDVSPRSCNGQDPYAMGPADFPIEKELMNLVFTGNDV
jgi:hypothetical protein